MPFASTNDCQYTYDGIDSGPSNWATFCSAPACDASSQSPIDIDTAEAILDTSLKPLEAKYGVRAIYEVENTGNTIQINIDGQLVGTIIGEQGLAVEYIKLHSFSEHTLDGKKLSVELQLVHTHTQSSNITTIISILFQVLSGASDDDFLDSLTRLLPTQDGDKATIALDLQLMLGPSVSNKEYFHYNGSLTSPPCSEDISWFVMKDVRAITMTQFDSLRSASALNGNARPIQPLNNRNVTKFIPEPTDAPTTAMPASPTDSPTEAPTIPSPSTTTSPTSGSKRVLLCIASVLTLAALSVLI